MNAATEHYLAQHQALADALPGRKLDWLQAQRNAGLARFEEVGFPTQRDEDWRYTPVKPITSQEYQPAQQQLISEPVSAAPLMIKGLKCLTLVFIDGLFSMQHSTSNGVAEGVTVAPLSQMLNDRPELIEDSLGACLPKHRHGFTALNESASRDGAVIILQANAEPNIPIEMLFIGDKQMNSTFAQPRNLVIAADGSKGKIIERYVSLGAQKSFTNSVTEVMLGENAELDYYLVQTQSTTSHHVCGIWARQARASRFSCRTITLGGALVRNDLSVELADEHAHCDMFGLYNPAGVQHVDNHTTMTHGAENCTSRELYKGVLEQRSRAVFHGRIVVRPGAQKTDAAQTNNNLLLSRHAEIDSKPQLEIYADDVKCSHGATVGQIDADALFYLRSRGLDEARARTLLTFAFVNDVVSEIEISELKEMLEDMLTTRLLKNQ